MAVLPSIPLVRFLCLKSITPLLAAFACSLLQVTPFPGTNARQMEPGGETRVCFHLQYSESLFPSSLFLLRGLRGSSYPLQVSSAFQVLNRT